MQWKGFWSDLLEKYWLRCWFPRVTPRWRSDSLVSRSEILVGRVGCVGNGRENCSWFVIMTRKVYDVNVFDGVHICDDYY